MPQNINVIQTIGLLAGLLAMFGLSIPPQEQADLATGIIALMAIITAIAHWWNQRTHAANTAAAVQSAVLNATGSPAVAAQAAQKVKP